MSAINYKREFEKNKSERDNLIKEIDYLKDEIINLKEEIYNLKGSKPKSNKKDK